MSKKVALILDSSKLDAFIVTMGTAATKVADMIQLALASSTVQALQHGNTNPLNAVIFAAGKGARKTAIVQWALAYAPVVPETDKEKAKENPLRFSKDRLAEMLDDNERTAEWAVEVATEAFAQHWTEHKEPPLLPEKWDAMAQVKALLKKGSDYAAKGVNVEHDEVLTRIAAMLAQGTVSATPDGEESMDAEDIKSV